LKYLPGKGDTPLDVVPVDTVSNGLVIATAHAAQSKQTLHIYNCSSSAQNPLLTNIYSWKCIEAFWYILLNQRMRDKLHLEWIENRTEYDLRVFLHFGLPVELIKIAS